MRPLRIFFATDIHGSETCFRKFINAGQAYQADALVMGGDITGKMIVLLVAGAGGIWSVQWLGARRTVTGDEGGDGRLVAGLSKLREEHAKVMH